MRSIWLNGRMAARRRTACLLVVLFTLAVTVFLLIYPRFIDSTRTELAYAYDSIPVTGWILNIKEFSDPTLEAGLWQEILDTGIIGEQYTYTTAGTKLYERGSVQRAAGAHADDQAYIQALKTLMEEEQETSRNNRVQKDSIRGINRMDTESGLQTQHEDIQWLDGYDRSCFNGREQVCLLNEDWGYLPGDRIPVMMEKPDGVQQYVCLTVAGVYPHALTDNVSLVVPLGTMEDLFAQRNWIFYVNGFSFTVADNRQLPALKATLAELGLNGVGTQNVRVSIDDRILDGTVSPIQSNLELLQGLHILFFMVVAVIGFFLCFLLARGRKQEYAVMRMLGESPLQVAGKALLEQLVLCACGVLLGGLMAGQGGGSLPTCGVILVCYTLGAAAAVLLTVRVNVMEILREEE